jgi:hypothetical protein
VTTLLVCNIGRPVGFIRRLVLANPPHSGGSRKRPFTYFLLPLMGNVRCALTGLCAPPLRHPRLMGVEPRARRENR